MLSCFESVSLSAWKTPASLRTLCHEQGSFSPPLTCFKSKSCLCEWSFKRIRKIPLICMQFGLKCLAPRHYASCDSNSLLFPLCVCGGGGVRFFGHWDSSQWLTMLDNAYNVTKIFVINVLCASLRGYSRSRRPGSSVRIPTGVYTFFF